MIHTCCCNRESVAHVRIIMTIVKTVSGIYTPLLQFTMTQQWLSLDPPIPHLSDTYAYKLPGYGIINPANADPRSLLVRLHRATSLVFSQTRSYPPQHGLRRDPLRLSGDRRRLWGSGRCSEGGGARSVHRRDRESQTRRYLRE